MNDAIGYPGCSFPVITNAESHGLNFCGRYRKTSMRDTTISSRFVLLVLALTPRASSESRDETRGAQAQTASIGNSTVECNPDGRSDILNPRTMTQLNFHGLDLVCRSKRCLEEKNISCRVEGWTASGNPQVRCASTLAPGGFSFSYTETRCDFHEKCIVKDSCWLQYELTAAGQNGENHWRTRRSSDLPITTQFLLLMEVVVPLLLILGLLYFLCRNCSCSYCGGFRFAESPGWGTGWGAGPWAAAPAWGTSWIAGPWTAAPGWGKSGGREQRAAGEGKSGTGEKGGGSASRPPRDSTSTT